MEDDIKTAPPNAIDSTKSTPPAQQAPATGQQQRLDAGDDSTAASAAPTSESTTSDATGWLHGIKDHIRENPLTSVGIVAALAYIWGATR